MHQAHLAKCCEKGLQVSLDVHRHLTGSETAEQAPVGFLCVLKETLQVTIGPRSMLLLEGAQDGSVWLCTDCA